MTSRVAATVSVVLVGLLPAGCSSDPLPTSSSAKVDLRDPDQVIANALEAMFTWDPAKESSPNDAYRRAVGYLSRDLAKQAENVPAPGQGSQWEQWRADGANIVAKANFVADETPPNSDDIKHRVVVIVQTATTSDRRLVDEIRHTAWVVANRSNDAWRVTSIQF